MAPLACRRSRGQSLTFYFASNVFLPTASAVLLYTVRGVWERRNDAVYIRVGKHLCAGRHSCLAGLHRVAHFGQINAKTGVSFYLGKPEAIPSYLHFLSAAITVALAKIKLRSEYPSQFGSTAAENGCF